MSDRKPASRVQPGDLSTLATQFEVIVGVSLLNHSGELLTHYLTNDAEQVCACWHRGSTAFVIAWAASR